MIVPLAAAKFPESGGSLRDAMQDGLQRIALPPRIIEVTAPSWPRVESLSVDLSGVTLSHESKFPKIKTIAPKDAPKLEVLRFVCAANPLTIEGVAAAATIDAHNVTFAWSEGDEAGDFSWLIAQEIGSGRLELRVSRKDLGEAVQNILHSLGAKNGVRVAETSVHFTTRDSRSVHLKIDLSVNVMMMKTALSVQGAAALDDDLNLRVSNLEVQGSGVAAGLASAFLKPHFDRIQANPISLKKFVFAGVNLGDVELTGGEEIRISAKFSNVSVKPASEQGAET